MISILIDRWEAAVPFSPLAQEKLDQLLKCYLEKHRHYHTPVHLSSMFLLAEEYAAQLQQRKLVDLAIFYHDVVYDPLKSDNEEWSADKAQEDLSALGLRSEEIARVCQLILATKKHEASAANKDLCFFLDFDLAVLGASWESYAVYAAAIRREYSVYPDLIYKPGRRKVLQHFLQMPAIFKTGEMRARFEAQARANLEKELAEL